MIVLRLSSIVTAAMILASLSSPAMTMTAYKWKNRPLVVFAPSESDPGLTRQRGIVSALRPAFQDRAIVIVYVVGDRVSAEMGRAPAVSAADLRARYGVERSAFRVLLVGKDGGVKLTSGSPMAAATLFSTIDAMPMRRNEMRKP